MATIVSILSYIVMRLMPTGRRIWALKRMREVALDMKLSELVVRIDAALAHDEKTYDLDRRWRAVKSVTSRKRGNSMEIDREIDARLSALRAIVFGFSVGKETREDVQSAKRILSKLFPSGIGEIVNLPFEEQHVEVGAMIAELEGELAADVKVLHLGGHVEELKELNEAFAEELKKYPVREVSWDLVKAARSEGHENLAAIIAWVVAHFSGRDSEKVVNRETLLAEFNRQQNAVYESQRRRQPVPDVDPETGEELSESDELMLDEPAA